MTDQPTNLDARRGMAAQKATDLRRLRSEVEADQKALRMRQAELEDLLAAAPATDWHEATEKARYLLGLLAQSLDASDLRRRKLIERVLADFDHLLSK
jgi:peptidoglycan hydrolase CwlO-like protein